MLDYKLSSTIHDGKFALFYEYPQGRIVDGSILYTNAGIQFTGSIGYSLLKKSRSQLEIQLGGMLRYQSSSFSDSVTILYPAFTGLDYPVVLFDNQSKSRTLSPGMSSALTYNYNFYKKYLIGGGTNFQFDSNGDNIFNVKFSLGMML